MGRRPSPIVRKSFGTLKRVGLALHLYRSITFSNQRGLTLPSHLCRSIVSVLRMLLVFRR